MRSLIVALFIGFFSFSSLGISEKQRLVELAFMFKIIDFTSIREDDFSICTLGENRDKDLIQTLITSKRAPRKIYNVREVSTDFENCSMLIVGKIHKEKKGRIRELILSRPLLTFTRERESKEFAMFYLKVVNNNVRFDVNKSVIKKSNLSISMKVLRLADEIY